jgi:uncharacterized membrane protein
VLDLCLPSFEHLPSSTQLAYAFWDLKASLFAFILSFAVIGNYWNRHRQFFGRAKKIDTRIVQLNICLLFCVAILPFPTSILAEYHPTFFAVAFYASVLAASGVISTAIRFHALEMMGINRRPAWPILKSRGLLASMLGPGVLLLSILLRCSVRWQPNSPGFCSPSRHSSVNELLATAVTPAGPPM